MPKMSEGIKMRMLCDHKDHTLKTTRVAHISVHSTLMRQRKRGGKLHTWGGPLIWRTREGRSDVGTETSRKGLGKTTRPLMGQSFENAALKKNIWVCAWVPDIVGDFAFFQC